MGYWTRCSHRCGLPEPREVVPEEPHNLEKARRTLEVVLWAVISTVMGRPSLLPLEADTLEALARSGRTLEVALGACHIERLVGGSRPADSGMMGHIEHGAAC